MSKVAILPAKGIGDALLLSIASHQLRIAGCEVTLFHNTFPELQSWFPGQDFQPIPSDLLATLSSFDTIIAENDNSPLIATLRSTFNTLCVFYPTYSLSKHGPLFPLDHTFIPNMSMAENIALALSKILAKPPEKSNGITPPAHLVHRRHHHRVLIHPTSSVREKNWLPERFVALAKELTQQGAAVVFTVSPEEREEWQWVEKRGFSLPLLPTLSDLAALIYESHSVIASDSLVGHLASNLSIPTVIIADDPKRMRLWQPGWLPATLVFPPFWIPNCKGMRWRKEKWQQFISVQAVLKAFRHSSPLFFGYK